MFALARASRAIVGRAAVVRAVATPLQVRTWFGFGMAKEADELEAEKQPFRPLYNRVVEDDTEEYLSPGPDTWTQEERNDREQLAREVFAMAEADPQVTPDLVFYKRAFTMLMKYDDWRGVITTRNLMIESAVKEDDDLGGLLDRYLEDAKARSYHEGGEW